MTLRELVDKYLELAGSFGRPVPLAAFGLSREETERLFSAFDEDYQISRFLCLSQPAAGGQVYRINGFPQTHVSIDAEIRTVL